MQGRMCPIRSVGVCLGAMIRKQWLESLYHLGSHPFLRVEALCYHFICSPDYPSVWLVSLVSFSPLTQWFQREMKESGLNLPSVTQAPCLPLSPTVVSISALFILHPLFLPFSHMQTRHRHSLVCCPSAAHYQKRLAPTYLETINHSV